MDSENRLHYQINLRLQTEITRLRTELEEAKATGVANKDFDHLDAVVKSELTNVAHSLCDLILLGGIDAEDSVRTLAGIIATLDYYSTSAELQSFLEDLPPAVIDVLIPAEVKVTVGDADVAFHILPTSNMAQNFQDLGFMTHMALAELGFITFSEMLDLAKAQQET